MTTPDSVLPLLVYQNLVTGLVLTIGVMNVGRLLAADPFNLALFIMT